jgi:hypothetical protein
VTEKVRTTKRLVAKEEPEGCHAHRDGECHWTGCPQLRDDEPRRSGRHCPLDTLDEER